MLTSASPGSELNPWLKSEPKLPPFTMKSGKISVGGDNAKNYCFRHRRGFFNTLGGKQKHRNVVPGLLDQTLIDYAAIAFRFLREPRQGRRRKAAIPNLRS